MKYKNIWYRIYAVLLLALFFGSCSLRMGDVPYLERSLDLAGQNRSELEKVLRHYEGDSLKRKAAEFLISYMPYHTYRTGTELGKIHRLYEVCSHHEKPEIPGIVSSFESKEGKIDLASLSSENDVRAIKSDFLIVNIEKAFEAWRHFPWSKNVPFGVFCEYVLPYRVGDEPPAEWRSSVIEQWKALTDSLSKAGVGNPVDAGRAVFDKLYQQHPVFSSRMPETPHVGPGIMRWKVGSCRDMCDILMYTFRALGIPCSKDFIVSGDYNTGHFWNSIPGAKEHLWIDLASGVFSPASAYKDVRAKAFRETYSQNEKIVRMAEVDSEELAEGFRYPNFIDVTPCYADGKLAKTLTFLRKDLLDGIDEDMPFYLCVPKKMKWVPVDMAVMEKGRVTFHDLKAGTVLAVGQYRNGGMQVCSLPMRTYMKGAQLQLEPFKVGKEEKVTLYSKFLLDEGRLKNMVGGVFEGSDNAQFAHPDTLYVITEAPGRLCTEVDVMSQRKYKYLRFRSLENSYCDVEDFAFYKAKADTVRLKGKTIGSKGDDMKRGWKGICLPVAENVRKIMYMPSGNDDSMVRKGDLYELFCWEGKEWKSRGCKEALSYELEFLAPKGALLYLRNLTRGRYERVFEYKRGKQIWW